MATVMRRGSQKAHDSLCRAIRGLLLLHGYPCWRTGQKGSQRRDGTWYAGHDKGAPDVFAIEPETGVAILIEAKSGARAGLTREQAQAEVECRKAGGIWITARSVTDVAKELGIT